MLPRCFVLSLLLLAPSLPRVATTDVVRVGRNIVLPADQRFHNANCFLCSAFVDGRGSGSLRVFAGNVLLNGAVAGRVVVFGGNVTLSSSAQVGKRVIIFGGHFQQDATRPEIAHTVLPPLIFLPLILLLCVTTGVLIRFTRRMVRGPRSYPPLPRL